MESRGRPAEIFTYLKTRILKPARWVVSVPESVYFWRNSDKRTYEECKKILETFQNNEAPGEHGFTVKFYTYFFELLRNDLMASFNEVHDKGELSISQPRGKITLVPKEDGSLLGLSYWRPLNVDFKIASKAIVKRIELTLPNLIHSDQTGFVKGKCIGENIRLISDIMEYTSLQNLPGILTSLYFRKAFDSIE